MERETRGQLVRARASWSVARHGLAELREFTDRSERLLKRELKALSKRVSKQVSCLPRADQEVDRGWFAEDLYQLADVFPRIQRYSLFVTTMAAIDNHLHHVCRCAKQICGQELSAADLRGAGIVRSLTYLTKVCHLRISRSSGSQVDHLTMYQKMRNAIVHGEGRPTGGNLKAIRQYQKRNLKFKLNARDELVLYEDFVSTVIHSAELLFETVFGEVYKRIKIAQQSTSADAQTRG